MTIAIPDRIEFLKKIHLFRGLDEIQLGMVAERLAEASYKAGEPIIVQNTAARKFYMIQSGTVRVMHTRKEIEEQVAELVTGDFFGTEAALPNLSYPASAIAQSDVVLFALSRPALIELITQFRILKPNFEVAISSERLALKMKFDWLQPGEVIYFLSRKHVILLWEAMILPVLVFLIPIGLLVGYLLSKVQPIYYLAIVVLIVNIAWIIWRVVDWGNDYYIVTNKRVIWLEKVIGLYDSHQEAPLSTILTVGIETDQVGRILDYGDVIVRTFVGRIAFYHAPHPEQAVAFIEEQWNRSKIASKREDVDALKHSIRQKLGLPVAERPKPAVAAPAPKQVAKKVIRLKDIIDRLNIFRVRFEDKGGTITYRKHWVVLFFKTWFPATLTLASLVLCILRFSNLPKTATGVRFVFFRTDPLLDVLILGFIAAVLWWIYRIWDWSNDIFQVTLEEIHDIYRKPLGREERRSAPLDNILSTEADRRGLLQILFNYGNVYISVGKMSMDFFDVYNPTSVQQDIDRRRIARVERKAQGEAAAERERLAEFFAMYHQSNQELRREQEDQGKNQVKNP